MSLALAGAGFGLLAGAGVVAAVAASPPMRRRHLVDRVAPYLREDSRPSRLLADTRSVTPFPTLERLLGPVLSDLARTVDGIVGGTTSVRRRLDALGRGGTVEQLRVEQVLWGAVGFGVGVVLAVADAALGGRGHALGFLVLAVVLAVAGVLARDRRLSVQVSRREQRMMAEFPTLADMVALAVTAGEGPIGALERVTRLSDGELALELRRVLVEARSGSTLVSALDAMAARISIPALARFVDGMATAVERGTPLAEVLRAQAGDVREEGRRALLEAGGRKEIAMLVPVVFLVLPITIVFALFPGFYTLRLAVS